MNSFATERKTTYWIQILGRLVCNWTSHDAEEKWVELIGWMTSVQKTFVLIAKHGWKINNLAVSGFRRFLKNILG